MTHEEIIKLYNELCDYFGSDLANFEHEPKRFAYQVMLYRYYRGKI